MGEFKAFESDVEVLGDVVLSVVHAMGAFKGLALEILERHGIAEPQKHAWYPQQAWLDAFATLAEEVGPSTVAQIGRQIPRQASFRPGLHSVDAVLLELDQAYKAAHRGGEAGSYSFRPTGRHSGLVTCRTPYPCDLERGLLNALADRFADPESLVDVRHEELPGQCKKHGHTSCTFHLRW